MRIVLVDNLLLAEKGNFADLDLHPHLGLLSLAAVAETGGHQVDIFDPKRAIVKDGVPYDAGLYRALAAAIVDRRPDVVGFTTLGCSFIGVVKIAMHVRARLPRVPILLGGPHATILHRQVLERFAVFDVVVRNEAEHTFLPVLDALSSGRFEAIPGVTYRQRGLVRVTPGEPTVDDLDGLPLPAYHLSPLENLGLDTLRVDAGRGCPFHCTFCSTASFFGRNYRLKSPERLVQELDLLHRRYGVTDFSLNHDLFTVDKRRVRAFCEAVRGRGYTWGCSARMDCVDAALLEAMAESGCRGIYFGIEAGSERMQRLTQKKMRLDLVGTTLDLTERLGMKTVVSLITGYPEEEQADQDATLDLLGDCFRRDRQWIATQLHMLTPEPGTALYAQYGERLLFDGYVTDFNAWTLEPDDADLLRDNPHLFVTHHHYPTVVPRERHVFAVEAYRLLRVVGHDIMRHTLSFFGGRLSVLVARMHAWARGLGAASAPDNGLLLAFIASEFGADHHLSSLFRYGLATAEAIPRLRQLRAASRPEGVPGRGTRYRLSPLCFLFQDIHDCGRILELLRRGATPGDGEVGVTGPLLALASIADGGALRTYHLDSETSAFLSLFRAPLSHDQLADLARQAGVDPPEWGSIVELIELGVLVPERAPEAGTVAAA